MCPPVPFVCVDVCRGTTGPDDVMQEIALIRNMKSAAEEERYADAGMLQSRASPPCLPSSETRAL